MKKSYPRAGNPPICKVFRVAPALHSGRCREANNPRAMDEISLRILSYLAENPEANDTPEGITEWWLLEREIREQSAAVERTLAGLAAEGWLLAARTAGSPTRYRLNPARVEEIRTLLEDAS